MLIGETVHTFQLDHQYVFDEEVGKILSDRVAFVDNCHRGLGGGPDAAKGEFPQEGSLVDLLQETGAQGVGDLKDRAEHTLR